MARKKIRPLDRVGREIQSVLSPDLLKPKYRGSKPQRHAPFDGYCYSATEAYFHLAGREQGLQLYRSGEDGWTHYWLEDAETGEITVLTLAPEGRRSPHEYE